LNTCLPKKVKNTTCLIIFLGDVSRDDSSGSKEDSYRISPGEIAGIVIGSIVVVIVAVFIIKHLNERARVRDRPPALNPDFIPGRRNPYR